MTVTVRTPTPADHQRWSELWHGYLTFYGVNLSNDVSQQTWQTVLTPTHGHDGLLAIDATGHAIGIAHDLVHRSTWTNGSYCYLEDLFVDPAARKCGAGSALIEAVEKAARAKNCARIYLATQTENAATRALYEKSMDLAPFVQYRKQLD